MTYSTERADARRNAVVYCRVGSHLQQDAGAIDQQDALCREYADKQGFHVRQSFADTSSGGTLNRPGLDRMFDFLNASEVPIHAVIIPNQSVAARSRRCWAELRQKLREMDIAIESPSKTWEETDQSYRVEKLMAAREVLEPLCEED